MFVFLKDPKYKQGDSRNAKIDKHRQAVLLSEPSEEMWYPADVRVL